MRVEVHMATYTVFSIEDSRLVYDSFDDQRSLEARCIALESEGAKFLVCAGDLVTVTIDRSPRITIGEPVVEAPVKKPRRKRRTRAEMEAARAAGEAKPKKTNGADATVAQ
jgi:hypothetical protein